VVANVRIFQKMTEILARKIYKYYKNISLRNEKELSYSPACKEKRKAYNSYY
jgi:hypothetical protein